MGREEVGCGWPGRGGRAGRPDRAAVRLYDPDALASPGRPHVVGRDLWFLDRCVRVGGRRRVTHPGVRSGLAPRCSLVSGSLPCQRARGTWVVGSHPGVTWTVFSLFIVPRAPSGPSVRTRAAPLPMRPAATASRDGGSARGPKSAGCGMSTRTPPHRRRRGAARTPRRARRRCRRQPAEARRRRRGR